VRPAGGNVDDRAGPGAEALQIAVVALDVLGEAL
jgi:hypothetical protein